MQSLARILFLFIVFLVADSCLDSFSYAEPPLPSTSSVTLIQNVDPNETILKFQQFLRDEEKEHRDRLESYYSKFVQLFMIIGSIVTAILTFFGWNFFRGIGKKVDKRFNETVVSTIGKKIEYVDTLIADLEDKVIAINKFHLEVANKLEPLAPKDINEIKSISFQALVGKKVLWVDDEPANNYYPRLILKEAGIKFTTTSSTDEALKYIIEDKFDLIISDMRRGANKIAGLELLETLKKQNINTPVIIYASSKAIKLNGENAIKLGALASVTGATAILNEVQKCFINKA